MRLEISIFYKSPQGPWMQSSCLHIKWTFVHSWCKCTLLVPTSTCKMHSTTIQGANWIIFACKIHSHAFLVQMYMFYAKYIDLHLQCILVHSRCKPNYFGPQVYPMGSLVITLVVCLSVCVFVSVFKYLRDCLLFFSEILHEVGDQ